MKSKRIAVIGDQYEITWEDGSVAKYGTLVSKGTKQKTTSYFDHRLKFSDGVETMCVLSTETAIIPDCSFL